MVPLALMRSQKLHYDVRDFFSEDVEPFVWSFVQATFRCNQGFGWSHSCLCRAPKRVRRRRLE